MSAVLRMVRRERRRARMLLWGNRFAAACWAVAIGLACALWPPLMIVAPALLWLGCCCATGSECPCGHAPTSVPSVPTTLYAILTNKTGNCTCLPDNTPIYYDAEHSWWISDPFLGCPCGFDESGEIPAYLIFRCYPGGYQFVPICDDVSIETGGSSLGIDDEILDDEQPCPYSPECRTDPFEVDFFGCSIDELNNFAACTGTMDVLITETPP
jgi:hypothetical protein